jgi:hypothetical protein
MVIDPSAFEPEGEEHQDRERWKITDAASADWALRKLAQARRRIDENGQLFAEELDRLGNWLTDANTPHVNDERYFESLLRNWHEEQLADDPKRKTISLPGGKLEARQNPDSIEITDPDTFFPWALENEPDFVRMKYEPERSAIKKAGGVAPHRLARLLLA